MSEFDKALSIAMIMLGPQGGTSKEQIAQAAKVAIQNATFGTTTNPADIDEVRLIRILESQVSWSVGKEFVIDSDDGHEKWLPAKKADIPWKFWKRYRRYLLEKPKPLSIKAVDSLDELTDKVLERLEDPTRPGPWDRRGMIVGQVQSGKTGNFIGLICKAADAGYRIIVVLAGIHDDLRSQTQMRVDEGFLGFSAAQASTFDQGNKRVGVGLLRTEYRAVAHSLTGYEKDFSRAAASTTNLNPYTKDPIILVVKKNKTILTNLIRWLASYAEDDLERPSRKLPLAGIPLLVIDDEADHASINTKEIPTDPNTGEPLDDYDVTAINGKIRQLLSLFTTKAYVGYTATPFANIFIRPDDESEVGTIGKPPHAIEIPYGRGLFPSSFIISLPIPSNYIGPVTVFGIDADAEAGIKEKVEPLPIINEVDDAEPHIPRKHNKQSQIISLPPSLKKAIRCFVLTCAARIHRGDKREHNSMLVHVTRFISTQKMVHDLVTEELKEIVNRLRYGDGASKDRILAELESLWNDEYVPTTETVLERINDPLIREADWAEVAPFVSAAAQKIVVRKINGESTDLLDYQNAPEGASVIAIGGDKLSRGLTLEGLSVSYFLRPSRMYDTLMQMGRWFGYRPGYLDLCRLFTTPSLVTWYKSIALASEELRREFELMVDLNKTPKDYGLRVRSDPNGLWITSLVKMRDSQTLRVSYDGRICETTVFAKDQSITTENLSATTRFLKRLSKYSEGGGVDGKRGNRSYVWRGVDASEVVGFLREYRTHPHAPKVNSALLAHYISKRANLSKLKNWTVVLISNTEAEPVPFMPGIEVGLVERKNDTADDESKYTIGRLLSPSDEMIDLEKAARDAALTDTREAWRARPPEKRSEEEPTTPSGPALRRQRAAENALLLIYPLDSKYAQLPYGDTPTIGVGISFPGDRMNPGDGVEYEANLVYIGKELDEND